MTKVHTSAVVIIPPEHLWGPIQTIRKQHDRAYDRWMPHINLLYPFYHEDQFEDCFKVAQKELENQKSFRITFVGDSFGHFAHGKNSTLWLGPLKPKVSFEQDKYEDQDEVHRLHDLLLRCFPKCTDLDSIEGKGDDSQPGTFRPHLSLGQFPTKEIDVVKGKFSSQWKEMNFIVDGIHFISRSNDEPFRVKKTLHFL